ncbi:GNAT family N-acetyltransferase [Parachitinimonas caeni]|uniref:GNAT family N-acetyltransferase n=1 Tax=Parachitinimonas caeni TaxID=3031301 RepID=A0ABT7E338_9NEIS|nr:GNAT family N-acetyltransferase [Parachitinimonas caeni]MDK2126659.1 GNAT family N-acetyltransferase [Parachitinimonas caeni]
MILSAEAAYGQAVEWVKAGQLEMAGAYFRQAAEKDPQSIKYCFDHGVWAEKTGRLPEAEMAFRQVLRLQSFHLGAAVNLTGLLLQVRRVSEALDVLMSLPKDILQSSHKLLNNLGLALLQSGNVEQANDCFEQAWNMQPLDQDIGISVCQGLMMAGRFTEAAQHAKQLGQRHLQSAKVQKACAKLFQELDFAAEARQCWQAALALNPDDPELRRGLAGVAAGVDQLLIGRRVLLRPFCSGRADFIRAAFNNRDFTKRLGRTWSAPGDLAALQAQIENAAKVPLPKRSTLEWVLEDVTTQAPLGVVVLTDIVWSGSRAEFTLGLLNPGKSLSGVALEAALLCLDLAFNQLHLRKLIAYVYGDNPKALQNVQALGFTQEGFLKDQIFDEADGNWLSLHYTAMLESEFRSNKRLSVLSQHLLGRDITLPQN